jgi:hypothetical protein
MLNALVFKCLEHKTFRREAEPRPVAHTLIYAQIGFELHRETCEQVTSDPGRPGHRARADAVIGHFHDHPFAVPEQLDPYRSITAVRKGVLQTVGDELGRVDIQAR